MAALSGSLSYARFFVEGETPRDLLDHAHEAVLLRAMRPLGPDDQDAERSGWCVLGEPLDVTLPRERVFLDGYVVLGLRTDRWAIPGTLLKSKLREAEATWKERSGRERLGRREKAELKEVVTRELRRRLVPSTRAIDLVWSLEEGVVRFFSRAQKPTSVMHELFRATFGIELVAESPFTQARRVGLSDEALAAWEKLEPTSLAPALVAEGGR